MTIFHKKASSQHYLINVLSAVIHGLVPVWIDGVMCLYVCVCVCVYVGVYALYVVRTEGGRVHLQLRPPWDLFREHYLRVKYDSGAIQFQITAES